MSRRNPKEPNLTPDEERFVAEYLIDRNGSAAYRRCHPGVMPAAAKVRACRLLKRPGVAAAVKLGSDELRRRCRVNAVKTGRELAMLAHYDVGQAFDLTKDDWVPLSPREMPYEVRRALVGVKVRRRHEHDRAGNITATVETVDLRFAGKLTAIDKLMRHFGLYKDLPPLEVLLNALDPEMSAAVRAATRAELERRKVSRSTKSDASRLPARNWSDEDLLAAVDRAGASLSQTSDEAVGTLRRCLRCGNPSVEVRAATAILDKLIQVQALEAMAEQISELQARFERTNEMLEKMPPPRM